MTTKTQQAAAGIGAALMILLGLVVASNQPKPTPPPPTPTTSTSSSTSITPPPPSAPGAPVERYFSDLASWNRPAAEFGPSTGLASYAQRWWLYAGGAAPPGTVVTAFDTYSVPIYPASSATTRARIFQTRWAQSLFQFGTAHIGDTIPWNPTWKPGSGNDNLLAVVDDNTGQTWELAGVGQAPINCVDLIGPNARAGFDPGQPSNLCLSGANTYNNLFTATDGTTIDGRGMGINKLALVTRAGEVRSGTIRHALEMTITATMFGQPACTPLRGPSAPGAGTDCGFYVPPATKLERTNPNTGCPTPQTVTPAERAKTIPEGMRFALHITDADIEKWLDSRNYTGPLRSTARVFAVALRDYGWIIAETGCYGSSIEIDGLNNPTQAATWKTLGVVPDGTPWPRSDLLTGLFTADRVYVVEPPAS